MSEIKSINIDNSKKIVKSVCIWGNYAEKNVTAVVMYIKKPKYMNEDDFQEWLDHMHFKIPEKK